MKKIIVGLLVISSALVIGCINKEVPSELAEDEQNQAAVIADEEAEENKGTKIIVDQNGREVEILKDLNRIATGRILPFPAVYFLATGSTDNIVGIHPASMSAAKTSMLGKISPSILKAETGFIQGDEINVEELLRLDTDIVFAYGDSGDRLDVYKEANIKTVGIKTMSLFNGNSLETLNSWLELLGEITENQGKAAGIIEYGRNAEKEIASKVEGLEKPKGLMIFSQSDGQNVVSGKGFFGNWWLNATGAIDVAENDIKMSAAVDMEQIYTWNPEIIYVTNFTDLKPDDFYNNTIEGQDWSEIDAVKNKRVYKIPLGIYRWFPPSGDTPLMLMWLAQKNHPETFEYDMNQVIKDYYQEYYDYSLSDDEVELILNPSDKSSEGYK